MGNYALNQFGLHWATQNFARPSGTESTYLLGGLYDDLDESGAWEPHNTGGINREGLGAVGYHVYTAGKNDQVGSAATFDNGGFSFRTETALTISAFCYPAAGTCEFATSC
jgi:hypothetical protein